MKERRRVVENVRAGDVEIVTCVDGGGPPIVVLPSYGRDGLEDFDRFTDLMVEAGLCCRRGRAEWLDRPDRWRELI